MKKVAITKCDFCSLSVNKNGKLVCPHPACIISRTELDKILKIVSNTKESEGTE